MPVTTAKTVKLLNLGHRPYAETLDLQRKLRDARIADEISDTLVLVEHEPVYTIGRNADRSNLLAGYPADVKIFKVERGGDITYHGPGQLVGYPILDLHGFQLSVGWFIHSLEEVLIRVAADFGVVAGRRPKYTGVWVGQQKLAALGVRLSRWVSMHGFAMNVATDLRYFGGIVPCGITDGAVTSLSLLTGEEVTLEMVIPKVVKHFSAVFGVDILEQSIREGQA